MNANQRKTKAKLIEELEGLRRRVMELEEMEVALKRADEALQRSEEELRSTLSSMHDLIFNIDQNGVIIDYFQPEDHSDLYVPPEVFIGKPFVETLPPHVSQLLEAAIEEVMATGTAQTFDYPIEIAGSEMWFTANVSMRNGISGEYAGVTGIVRNITVRKRTEDALRESEEKFRSLVETTSDWVWEVDINGIYTYVSPKIKDLLGYEPEEVLGKTPFDLMPADEAARVAELFRDIAESRKAFTELENTNLTKDGRKVVLETSGVPILGADGTLLGYRGIDREITERRRHEERIEHLALYDHLTNLANRGLFFNSLTHAISRADRYKHFVFLLYIDLDGFKFVNDEFGHKAGDSVLIEVGKRIQDCVRKIDTAARLGGDEFAVILADIEDKQYVKDVADRIIKSINCPIDINGENFKIGSSIGISIYPDDGQVPDILLQKADAAMYRVKKTSRNSYLFSGSS